MFEIPVSKQCRPWSDAAFSDRVCNVCLCPQNGTPNSNHPPFCPIQWAPPLQQYHSHKVPSEWVQLWAGVSPCGRHQPTSQCHLAGISGPSDCYDRTEIDKGPKHCAVRNPSNAHVQPLKRVRDVALRLKLPLTAFIVWANSEGSGETARIRGIIWAFAVCLFGKYHFFMCRLKYWHHKFTGYSGQE